MRRLLLPLLLLLVPLNLLAWGADGHRAVALIADRHLTPKARRAVLQLLGTETLPLVSTWPDEIRYYPEYKDTAPWHYVNAPGRMTKEQYLQYLRTQTDPNAYNVLQVQLHVLKDPNKPLAERQAALKYIVHIVGDAHQPLHAGHADDKGGNDIKVKYRGKDTNLHSLWDSGLIEYQGLSYTEMALQYDQGLDKKLLRQWQAASPELWFWESYQASEQLYQETASGADVDFRYFPAHYVLMRQRIQQAGVRLAAVLNTAFDK